MNPIEQELQSLEQQQKILNSMQDDLKISTIICYIVPVCSFIAALPLFIKLLGE